MEKTIFLSLLLVLSVVHGFEENAIFDDSFMDEDDGQWNEEDDDDGTYFPPWRSEGSGRNVVNVDSFGAVGDGISDDTQAFRRAWDMACSTEKSVFLVPMGRRYLVNATRFRGPCSDNFIIQISGTIIAPREPNDWDPKNPRVWLVFSKLSGVIFQGGGVLNGSGAKWWATSCKTLKTKDCRSGTAPTALTIDSSSGIRVRNLNLKDSQQIHFDISRSNAVRVSEVRIEAPFNSPNTDGIHISESTNVVLQNCKIGTGDDCISIVNGTSKLRMKNIDCGPGHGISIGSLGKDNTMDIVTAVVLDTAILRGTANGLRIKTWQGGSGYARALRFENVKMIDVANPIIIDQFYCDSPTPCKNQTSAVKISQVIYKNISGTSKTEKAMKFACSDTVPCSNIILANINLVRENGTAETYCNCAMGFDYGRVQPSADCLRAEQNSRCDAMQDTVQVEVHDYVHTDL